MNSTQQPSINVIPPAIALLPLTQFLAEFDEALGEKLSQEDFVELLRQLFHELLNKHYMEVFQSVGVSFPVLDRFVETHFLYEPARANQLTIATSVLTTNICNWLNQAGLFERDGTLNFVPKRFCFDLVVLEHLPELY